MKNLTLRNYHFYIEGGLLIIGVLILFLFANPLRFFGVAYIASAFGFYSLISSFKSNIESNNDNFRSRVRDEILKHQYKMK
jgi:hypothetical protein